jgi:hypothetical protein
VLSPVSSTERARRTGQVWIVPSWPFCSRGFAAPARIVRRVTAIDDHDIEQQELRRLKKSLAQVDEWLPRTDPAALNHSPHSPIAGDDRKTNPFQTSHAVASALLVAVDHAHALRRLMEGCEKCNPSELRFLLNSYYSLLRGALENASRAIWLLAPERRSERVLRRLRLQADNIVNSNSAASLLGATPNRPKSVRLDRVREIADRAGVDPDQAVRRPVNREVVRSAGSYIGKSVSHEDHIEALWRACSGAAHGDTWAALSLHDKEVMERGQGIVLANLTASTRAVSIFTDETFIVIAAAFHLFDVRNRAPY